MLKRDDHVADESLGVNVGHARFRIARLDGVTDGLHEMRLAETHAAVDEQRVVGAARILGHLHGRGLGELVALAFHEPAEGEIGIEANTYDNTFAALGPDGRTGLGLADPHGLRATRAHLDGHDGRVAFHEAAHHLAET